MKKPFILTFACCLIGLMSPNLHADLVVDQSQPYSTGSVPIPYPIFLWMDPNGISQSFTPTMDNIAGASVSIGLLNSSNLVTVTMELWDKAPWDPTAKLVDMLYIIA